MKSRFKQPHGFAMPFCRHVGHLLLAALLLFVIAQPADAHRQNESYVFFNVTDLALSGRIEATLPDLDKIVLLDADGDGTVSREEFSTKADEVFGFFAQRLIISHDGQEYPIAADGHEFLDTPAGTFALIHFTVPGLSPTPDAVDVTYRSPFQEREPGHLGFGLIESNTRTGVEGNERYISMIFEPGGESHRLSLVGEPALKIFKDFVIHGIWHIWLGFDHVVFLITLLMPSVLTLSTGAWQPVANFRAAFINVLKVVTVFTVSHTITLSLSSLGIIRLPVTLVEVVIALSIAVVALGNMFPVFHRYTLLVVFAFGLFHGFGFANVLAPLGLQPSAKLIGLAAFNIGVELGQIAIVAAVFPVLYLLRRWNAYPFLALRVASVCFILLAGVWFIERSSGVFWRLQQQLLGLLA